MHLVLTFSSGGAERVLARLINDSPANIKHIICSFYKPDNMVNYIKEDNRTVISLSKKHGNDFSLVRKIRKHINKHRATIVFAWGWAAYIEGFMAAKCRLKPLPLIFGFHGKTYHEINGVPYRRIIAHRILAKFTDAIVTPSFQMREDFSAIYSIPQKKIQVIYNGLDLKETVPSPGHIQDKLRKEFGLNKSDFVIGLVARFDPVKNIPLLLKSFSIVLSRIPEARLLLVGYGAEENNLRNISGSLGIEARTIFTGKRNDVPDILRLMDIYVQPSHYEGMCVALIEAMACGLATIATEAGGNSEVLEHGKCGRLVNTDNAQAMAKEIHNLYLDTEKRRLLGKKARQHVINKFQISDMTKEYSSLFRKIAAKGRQ